MQFNSYNQNDKNTSGDDYNIHESDSNQETLNDRTGNLSYFPADNGTYNCYTSSGSFFSTQMESVKKWTALMLVVFSLISACIGFITAKLAYTSSRPSHSSGGNQYFPSPDNVIVNVVPSRPKIETSTIPNEERIPMTVSQVCAKVLSENVEIITETASYNQHYGYYVTEGAGSGVIISKDGYIITNHHVIENAQSITVRLSNGNSYDNYAIALKNIGAVSKYGATKLFRVCNG